MRHVIGVLCILCVAVAMSACGTEKRKDRSGDAAARSVSYYIPAIRKSLETDGRICAIKAYGIGPLPSSLPKSDREVYVYTSRSCATVEDQRAEIVGVAGLPTRFRVVDEGSRIRVKAAESPRTGPTHNRDVDRLFPPMFGIMAEPAEKTSAVKRDQRLACDLAKRVRDERGTIVVLTDLKLPSSCSMDF